MQEESSTSVEKNGTSDLYVVGVGASAGGLDALTKFLKNFNGINVELCIVVVMHLSPKYKSQLAPILDKRCKWPVIAAEDDVTLSSGKVYVTPQNKQIRIQDNKFSLTDLSPEHAFTPSIDNFFISLAEEKAKKAIGVILSGFGKDGSKGMTSIKQMGGFTIAQLPETAEHRDMPTAAIDTGDVNLVVPSEHMYDDIVQYISNSHAIATSVTKSSAVDAIFELLEKRSGTDFSMYKPSTIMRRINHRINSLQLRSMMDYYELIKSNPRELDNLFDAVLIGVTEFFRDIEAFDHLRNKLEVMVESKESGDTIRIWSVGCATGEEAYSIAILIHELLGPRADRFNIQIFATDIDERAINFGRKGIYNKEILGNVPAEIINKYFQKNDDLHYQIKKEIRQHVLFTRHDITTDPPFVKLDLLTCRNLLIYFNNNLQKQTFQIFHYSLKPQGLLFLGKSESVSVAADLFSKSGAGKIYRKADGALNYQLKFSRLNFRAKEQKKEVKKSNIRNMSIAEIAKETLYHKFDNPFVVINDASEIKEVHGSLRLYLEISQGTMNVNLLKMVNSELVMDVKAVLAQVKKTNIIHSSHVIKFKLYEQLNYVRIKIIPLIYRINEMQYYLVIFERVEPTEAHLELQKKLETSDFVNLRIQELEEELSSAQEHLQIFTEELEATNEELQTINEELQSSNEELKTSNEELETSNEELQSANEELNTANQELRLTNELLLEKEKDLKDQKEISERNELIYRTISENIPDGVVGILNKDLEIEYLAGHGIDEMSMEDTIGKYMPSLNPSKREAKRIEALCRETLKGKQGSIDIKYNNSYYVIKTVLFKLPDAENKILYLAQETTSLRQNQIILETALKASNLIVFEYDFERKEIQFEQSLYKSLGLTSKNPISEAEFLKKVHPEDVAIRIADMKQAKKTGRIQHEIRLIVNKKVKYVRITGKVLFDENKIAKKGFATILDVTQDKILLQELQKSEERFRIIADSAPMSIWITEKNSGCIYINKTWLDFTNSTLEDNLGDGWIKFIHQDDKELAMNSYMTAFKNKEPYTVEYRLKKYDGTYEWVLINGIPKYDALNNFEGFLGSVTNIHSQIEFSDDLEEKVETRTKEILKANKELVKLNMNLEEFAYMASHDLKEPLRKIRTFNSLVSSDESDKESIAKYTSRIESSAERMTSLIDNILEYSKIDQNSIKLKKVNLDTVISEVLSDLHLVIQEKNVIIKLEPLGKIKGIPISLYQLFSNIIRNGIKFNENQPSIQVTTVDVFGSDMAKVFKVKADSKFKKISFKDNGIGFNIDKRDYIFKPFKKLNSSSEYTGTGIGLAICKRIMDLHGGCVDVESGQGDGSTFMCYFPINNDL